MKFKKTLKIAVATIFTAGIMASSAYAAAPGACFGAQITRIGSKAGVTTSSGHRLEVLGGTCNFPQYHPVWLATDLGDAGLATALTALSLGYNVTLIVPDNNNIQADDLITAIHIEVP